MSQQPGLVLVVGSGGRRYREYLLKGASRHHRLWLLEGQEPTWQKAYIEGSAVVPLLNRTRLIPDQEGLIRAALELAARQRIDGVFSYDETLIVATAHIADRLGLPGLTIEGVENCRNKLRTRTALSAAGLLQPRFALVRTIDEALAGAAWAGYPVVLKPQGMGASIGVTRASDSSALLAAFEVALKDSYGGNPAYEGGVLVEEMLTGPEISVDGLVVAGSYRPLFLAHKTVGFHPYFEELAHVVVPGDPLLSDPQLLETLKRAHAALGLRFGITHTEVKLTPRGPAIVEVNGRLGGDLIPYLGQLATGLEAGELAAEVALGRRPEIAPSPGRPIGIRFLYPPLDCRVREVSLPRPGRNGLLEAAPMAEPGAELRLPPRGYIARYAFVICTADDVESCRTALERAAGQASLVYDQLAVVHQRG